jgi:hypothetical protein
MILECKRPRGNSRWYFLRPSADGKRVRHLFSDLPQSVAAPRDSFLQPESAESSFCVVPGEGGGRRPLLEKMIDELLQSLEAFALEEYRLNQDSHFRRLYVPVIVTNARLFTCTFDPANVSLETGEIPADANFEEVPCIRFRKTLWSHIVSGQPGGVIFNQGRSPRPRENCLCRLRCWSRVIS